MEFWASLGFSLFLLLAAAVLMALHIKAWRWASRREQAPRELDFHRRHFRRRMQCSAMLGFLGIAVFVGQWIAGPPILVILFWGANLLIVAWLALLAVADTIVTVHHFQALRDNCLVEQAKLNAEAKRLRSLGGNGKARKKPLGE